MKFPEASSLVEIINKIEHENPLSLEHETDARYVWAKRWAAIKAALGQVMEE